MEGSNKGNIIHYESSRCRPITRPVITAEVHGILYGFDNAIFVQNILEDEIRKKFDIHGMIDCKAIFNVITKTDANLRIDYKIMVGQ